MEKMENLAKVFNSVKKAEGRWNLYLKRSDDSVQFDCAIEHILEAIKASKTLGDKDLNVFLRNIIRSFAKKETATVLANMDGALNRTAELICEEIN